MAENYTANEIRDMVLGKQAEKYYGKLIIYFEAGNVPLIEYSGKFKKPEGTTRGIGGIPDGLSDK